MYIYIYSILNIIITGSHSPARPPSVGTAGVAHCIRAQCTYYYIQCTGTQYNIMYVWKHRCICHVCLHICIIYTYTVNTCATARYASVCLSVPVPCIRARHFDMWIAPTLYPRVILYSNNIMCAYTQAGLTGKYYTGKNCETYVADRNIR